MIHKGDLQHSLLAQFPLVCGKNVRIPFKRRDLCQSGNVHNGKTIPFAMREFPKCSLYIIPGIERSKPTTTVAANWRVKSSSSAANQSQIHVPGIYCIGELTGEGILKTLQTEFHFRQKESREFISTLQWSHPHPTMASTSQLSNSIPKHQAHERCHDLELLDHF